MILKIHSKKQIFHFIRMTVVTGIRQRHKNSLCVVHRFCRIRTTYYLAYFSYVL